MRRHCSVGRLDINLGLLYNRTPFSRGIPILLRGTHDGITHGG